MRRFFFTFSAEGSGQAFVGGWVEIYAEDRDAATEVFRKYYPDTEEGYLNCAEIYSEAEFIRTKMYLNGNYGEKCHDILYQQESITAETKAGEITAYINADKDVAPGISVMLKPRGYNHYIDLAYIEVKQDEDIRRAGENDDDVFVRVYADVHNEDCTDIFRITRKDIEEEHTFRNS